MAACGGLIGPNGAVNLLRTTTLAGYHDGVEHYVTSFQFAGGSRDQAQQLSKALQDKGYKIPAEQRTGDAAGKHEVRYFYAGQQALAAQLAADATQALQRLGYPSLSVSAVRVAAPTASNTDGKLELWLEIPPK